VSPERVPVRLTRHGRANSAAIRAVYPDRAPERVRRGYRACRTSALVAFAT
jgi:hypothetical protein